MVLPRRRLAVGARDGASFAAAAAGGLHKIGRRSARHLCGINRCNTPTSALTLSTSLALSSWQMTCGQATQGTLTGAFLRRFGALMLHQSSLWHSSEVARCRSAVDNSHYARVATLAVRSRSGGFRSLVTMSSKQLVSAMRVRHAMKTYRSTPAMCCIQNYLLCDQTRASQWCRRSTLQVFSNLPRHFDAERENRHASEHSLLLSRVLACIKTFCAGRNSTRQLRWALWALSARLCMQQH